MLYLTLTHSVSNDPTPRRKCNSFVHFPQQQTCHAFVIILKLENTVIKLARFNIVCPNPIRLLDSLLSGLVPQDECVVHSAK